MAVAIANDHGVIEDSDANPVVGAAGSNRLVLCCTLMTLSSSGATLTTHQLNATNFDSDNGGMLESGSSSPWIYGVSSHFLDGNSPTTGNYDITTSPAYSNTGAYIVECTGVDQTTPIADGPDVLKGGGTTANFPVHTINYSAGDLVVYVCTTNSARTITGPSALNGTDAWTTQINNDATLVGGGAAKGSVFTCITSTTETGVTFNATIDTADNIRGSMAIVVKAAPEGIIIPVQLGPVW